MKLQALKAKYLCHSHGDSLSFFSGLYITLFPGSTSQRIEAENDYFMCTIIDCCIVCLVCLTSRVIASAFSLVPRPAVHSQKAAWECEECLGMSLDTKAHSQVRHLTYQWSICS